LSSSSHIFLFVYLLFIYLFPTEADTGSYQKLIVNRPSSINIQTALCDTFRTIHAFQTGDPAVRGIFEFSSEDRVKGWHADVNPQTLPTVQCVPIRYIFQVLAIKWIDIWILDVEGAEEAVLQGTDFNKIKINTIVMECGKNEQIQNKRKLAILATKGYHCEIIGDSAFCRHHRFKPSQLHSS